MAALPHKELPMCEFTEVTISAEYGKTEGVFEYAENQCRKGKEQVKTEKDFNFRFERNSMQYHLLLSDCIYYT